MKTQPQIGDKVIILGGVPIFIGLNGTIESYTNGKYNVIVGGKRDRKGLNYITRLSECDFNIK